MIEMERTAFLERKTNETDIKLRLNLDGSGNHDIYTGIGFLDHMLNLLTKHGFFDLYINASGDVEIDSHHTVEDVGIVFGDALYECLGDKKGIKRYGHSIVPMDESLCLCAVDLSGRPYLNFEAEFTAEMLGNMEAEMIEEFFRAASAHGEMNLHIKILSGKNNHHMAEAIFKAFARALDMATSFEPRLDGVLSTKGMLEGKN